MPARLIELRRYVQGWVGYFRLVPLKSFYDDLDKWIRRRVRACFWQQWRNPRTRIRNLLKLGIREREAYTHGSSSKGPWVMSSSKAIHRALSTDYLKQSGLSSLLTIWTSLLLRDEPPSADPHARWCGSGPQQCGPYADSLFAITSLCWRVNVVPALWIEEVDQPIERVVPLFYHSHFCAQGGRNPIVILRPVQSFG